MDLGLNKKSGHDWKGENVAGLIVMKVRDELLGQRPSVQESDTTLSEMISDVDLETSVNVDTQQTPLEDSTTKANVSTSTVIDSVTNADVSTSTLIDQDPIEQRTRDKAPEAGKPNAAAPPTPREYPNLSQRARGYNRRGKGRGRGRGRGGWNPQPYREYQPKKKRPQDVMSESDRSFLYGKGAPNANKKNQSSKSNCADLLGLTEAQVKALESMGLAPNS